MKKPSSDSAVTLKKLSALTPDARNANKGSAAGNALIEKSLRKYGAGRSILLDKHGAIIAGNKTAENAIAAGLDDVLVVKSDGTKLIAVQRTDLDLNDPKARELAIADNRAGQLSLEWDPGVLKELEMSGVELSEFWSAKELENMWPATLTGDEDAVPEAVTVAKSKLGDLWKLGKHRLLCGDSTVWGDFERLMAGTQASCVFTDPPYGVSIGSKNQALNSVQKAGRCVENIKNDTLSPEALYPVLKAAFTNCRRAMADCCAFYATAPQGGGLGLMMMMMKDAGLEIRHVLIWVKNSATFSIGRLDYDYQHEPIMFTWKKTHKRINQGQFHTSVWTIDKPRESKLHPTMKPVALIENALLNSSEAGDSILDPFGGSGSTMIACEKTARKCFMMELDPAYCDVIVQRWETATGKRAKLEGTNG